MSKNKLNILFSSIGDNALNDEKTSLDIISEYLKLNTENKLKVKGNSIFGLLGCRNGGEIISTIRGITKQSDYNEKRKSVVNFLLELADFSELTKVDEDEQVEQKEKTKEEKLQDKMQKWNTDYQVVKTNESIRNNRIRTMANRLAFPLVLLIAKGNYFYKFHKSHIEIFVKSLSNEQLKSVFGVDREQTNAPNVLSFNSNLTTLEKLSKVVLNAVINEQKETEKTFREINTKAEEITKKEDVKKNSKKILKIVENFLDYFDKNKCYDELMKIEDYIWKLEHYGHKKGKLAEQVRQQTKGQKDIFLIGKQVVKFENADFENCKTFSELETKFNNTFKIA